MHIDLYNQRDHLARECSEEVVLSNDS